MTTTQRRTIAVKPLTPHVGGEISGIDLTQTLDAGQVAELNAALIAYRVIFFRDQQIDMAALKALGRHFGELHIHSGMPGHPDPSGDPAAVCRRKLQARRRRGVAYRPLVRPGSADGDAGGALQIVWKKVLLVNNDQEMPLLQFQI